MSINFNHVTNDISASSGSVTINGSAPGGGSSTLTISNKTGAYTVVAGDNGTIINCTSGSFTVTLTDAATLGSGFNVIITNTSSTLTQYITISPSGTNTIDGNNSSILLYAGQSVRLVCDGTSFRTISSGFPRTMIAVQGVTTSGGPAATGAGTIAMGPTATASASYAISLGRTTQASGSYSTAIGLNSAANGSQSATGSGAMALGGSYASGTDSFAAAIANNTSSFGATATSTVAIGNFSKSTANYSSSFGYSNTASGISSLAAGNGSSASSTNASAIGAYCAASQSSSFATGTYSSSAFTGKYAYASGRFSVTGDAQTGTFILRRATTDATATVLTSDNSSPSSLNQAILPDNSAYAFTGIVVARQQAAGGTASAAWKVEGLIRREAGAGTTTLVASIVTPISNVPLWTLALSADTTNGGLAITATGAAATNIRWVATINTSEVTYA